MNAKANSEPRIAWLLTSAFYYWQPMICHLKQLFPETMMFTARWHGYAPGYENLCPVEIVGERKIIELKASETGYGSSFTYLPLSIVNALFRFKPDIIFSNSFGVWTLLSLLFKPIGRWQVVIAYEGSSPSVDYRQSPLRLALRRVMIMAADACISNSQAGFEYLVDILHAPKQRVFVHPYEVPSVQSLSLESGEQETAITLLPRPIFLFVGSLTPRKGLLQLLEACLVLKQRGLINYSIAIVGDGQQRDTLQEFSQKNDLENNIHWIGKLNYDQLGLYFQQADAFILPTLEDTWGVVILEAMALGKAILCSNRAGASELVSDGHNGYIFDPYSPEQMADAMSHLIVDPALGITLGQHSKERMAQYTPDAAAQFLSRVTYSVLGTSDQR